MHFLTLEEKRISVFNRDSVPSAIPRIPQGGSYSFIFDRAGEDIADWSCRIELKVFPDDTAIISRVITPEGEYWKGMLTQTETEPLDVGLHFLIAKLSKPSTGEEEQILTRLQIMKAWV